MTQDEFFDWSGHQELRYEFDGTQPVAMTGGTVGHSIICQNLWSALRARLQSSAYWSTGPDVGVETVGTAVRYPDAIVLAPGVSTSARKVSGVVAVFEVISPTSGRMDRIVKVQEYAAVPTVLRYIVIELTSAALTSFGRRMAGDPWMATTLIGSDTLSLPEIGIELPVAELYAGIDFAEITPASD